MKKLVLFSTVLGAFVFGSKEVFAVTPATSEGTATLQTLDESEAGTVPHRLRIQKILQEQVKQGY